MTLVLDDPELDRLATELAAATGVPVVEAAREAVKDKLATCGKSEAVAKKINWAEVDRALDRMAKLPVLDDRTADEIIGYDENGLPS